MNSALVNASGDLRLGDPPPGKKGWTVGISSLGEEPAWYRELSNVGVASSGDANRYIEIDGIRYSHIIAPRTCDPLTRRCVATVLAPTATTADALASALCVLGPEEAPEIFERIRREGIGDGKELAPFEYALFAVNGDADPPYEDDQIDVLTTAFLKTTAPSQRARRRNSKDRRTRALATESSSDVIRAVHDRGALFQQMVGQSCSVTAFPGETRDPRKRSSRAIDS